jgi:hypothetical protein
MPDENRVFDVTKPKHISPTATSKPVIVGHHPIMSDPMVKDSNSETSSPTKIPVSDSGGSENSYLVGTSADNSPAPEEHFEHIKPNILPPEHSMGEPTEPEEHAAFKITPPPDEDQHSETPADIPQDTPGDNLPAEPINEPAPPAGETHAPSTDAFDLPPPDQPTEPSSQIQGLHFQEHKKSGKGFKIGILVIVLALIGAYLAIDAGAVGSGIALPFHVFKQKAKVTKTPTQTQTNANQTTTVSVPAGFKEYKIGGTALTFAAPVAWGDPTSTTDPGYSKRGGNNQSDGTYAYLVNFANNKDIQVAVTSDKYLPPARDTTYYDFLQWCTGTNDGNIYLSVLHYNTTNKIDVPATVACDQGPAVNASKLNPTTILQTKVPGAGNTVIGDVYTKNIKDPLLAVFRVRDGAMTNGDNIKQLLNTVKVNTPASNTNQ